MNELWMCVDKVIDTFVCEEIQNDDNSIHKNKSFIIWKDPILYAIRHGLETNNVLRGSKTIISVPSVSAAEALKLALKKRLSEDDLLVWDTKTKKKRPFKLNIKIIECPPDAGQLILKKSNIPVTQHGISIRKIFELIENQRKQEIDSIKRQQDMYDKNNMSMKISLRFKMEENEVNERYDEITKKVSSVLADNKKYCIHWIKPYAMAYRITYTSGTTQSRKQTAIGDVLIVINGTAVAKDQRITKARTDTFELKNKNNYIISAGAVGIYTENVR